MVKREFGTVFDKYLQKNNLIKSLISISSPT